MTITIRHGTIADGPAAVRLLRGSITELCAADHGHDAERLAGWLGNKTVAVWAGWLARPDAAVLVAETGGRMAGIGMVEATGAVLLNYVGPDARFQGVSTALLAAMEAIARDGGARACRLESTATARRFYESRGYAPQAPGGVLLSKPL
ncbi:GNAT family N-acetyltransferase [Poseidonocella sp. HB161398]|uniref:GNAT family N-acetyltransferase n=1 Tax=Poseidonocella sp. HB161398 TaxID=2320855 RepID=UPI0014863E6C|nr:GNAT family N-acetyltransferase [Poseidonocella sp. HB161398]